MSSPVPPPKPAAYHPAQHQQGQQPTQSQYGYSDAGPSSAASYYAPSSSHPHPPLPPVPPQGYPSSYQSPPLRAGRISEGSSSAYSSATPTTDRWSRTTGTTNTSGGAGPGHFYGGSTDGGVFMGGPPRIGSPGLSKITDLMHDLESTMADFDRSHDAPPPPWTPPVPPQIPTGTSPAPPAGAAPPVARPLPQIVEAANSAGRLAVADLVARQRAALLSRDSSNWDSASDGTEMTRPVSSASIINLYASSPLDQDGRWSRADSMTTDTSGSQGGRLSSTPEHMRRVPSGGEMPSMLSSVPSSSSSSPKVGRRVSRALPPTPAGGPTIEEPPAWMSSASAHSPALPLTPRAHTPQHTPSPGPGWPSTSVTSTPSNYGADGDRSYLSPRGPTTPGYTRQPETPPAWSPEASLGTASTGGMPASSSYGSFAAALGSGTHGDSERGPGMMGAGVSAAAEGRRELAVVGDAAVVPATQVPSVLAQARALTAAISDEPQSQPLQTQPLPAEPGQMGITEAAAQGLYGIGGVQAANHSRPDVYSTNHRNASQSSLGRQAVASSSSSPSQSRASSVTRRGQSNRPPPLPNVSSSSYSSRILASPEMRPEGLPHSRPPLVSRPSESSASFRTASPAISDTFLPASPPVQTQNLTGSGRPDPHRHGSRNASLSSQGLLSPILKTNSIRGSAGGPSSPGWTVERTRSPGLPSVGEGAASSGAPQLTLASFVDFSMLSNIAMLLRDSVPRAKQIKGSVVYPCAFTGKDVVNTVQSCLPRELTAWAMGLASPAGSTGQLDAAATANAERRVALLIAKSLKSQLFFHEVDWDQGELRDGVEEVYMFLEDSLEQQSQDTLASRNGGRMAGASSAGQDDLEAELHYARNGRGMPRNVKRSKTADLQELPTGIFTPLTACYSPLCAKPGSMSSSAGAGCYSPSCPRAARNVQAHAGSGSRRPLSLLEMGRSASTSDALGGADSNNAIAWAETVPAEFLSTLPKQEVKRQNAIFELIQKEEEFLKDLQLLESVFLRRLEKPNEAGDPPPIAIGPERDAFVAEVFSNHRELTLLIQGLVDRLHVRQREEGPVVRTVGDIYLDVCLQWGPVFDVNMTNCPLAKHRVQREATVNPRFKDFLEACRRDPACRRLSMEHFLQRAMTRLPRYQLHFKSILEATDEGNPDRESLARATEVVDEQCKAVQANVAAAQVKVRIREYAYNLATKRNKLAIDMGLLHPQRQLVHQGRVYRKPEFTDFEWTDLLAVLFDNYFVVTKTKRRDEAGGSGGAGSSFEDLGGAAPSGSSKFVLVKRPIPVEMLELSGFNDPSISRSLGLGNLALRSTSSGPESSHLWPFTVNHIGGKLEPLTLYVSSQAARDEWRAKLQEAKGLRAAVQEANRVYDVHTLSENVFGIPSMASFDPERPPVGVDPSVFHGKVTCAAAFTAGDRRQLVAIGCADGVWIGLRHDPASLRKVLHLKLVTQCAVLEEFGLFVVLADKVLIAYSLEALVPSSGASATPRPPQKLSGNRDVVLFSVGRVKERTLLVYMKRRANESVFRALEPVMEAGKDEGGKSGGLFGRFGSDRKGGDWFRIYKTFFIPSEAYAIQYMKSKLCIVCARGFEIMNLETLLPGTIPDFSHCPRDDPRIQVLLSRVERAKPLAMFKISETEFLLCYDAFACYVDRLGEPIRLDSIIEWEGTPTSVAFQAPFVLAFDHRFVEIRDATSGELVQVMRAYDLKSIGGSTSLSSEGDETIILSQRNRVKGVATPFDFQVVFELVSDVVSRRRAMGGAAASSTSGTPTSSMDLSKNHSLRRMPSGLSYAASSRAPSSPRSPRQDGFWAQQQHQGAPPMPNSANWAAAAAQHNDALRRNPTTSSALTSRSDGSMGGGGARGNRGQATVTGSNGFGAGEGGGEGGRSGRHRPSASSGTGWF